VDRVLVKPLTELRADLTNKKDGVAAVAGVLADPFNKAVAKALTAALGSARVEPSLRQPRGA